MNGEAGPEAGPRTQHSQDTPREYRAQRVHVHDVPSCSANIAADWQRWRGGLSARERLEALRAAGRVPDEVHFADLARWLQ